MVQGSKLYRSLISSAAALSILTIGATALAADDDDDDKKKDEEAPKPKPRRRERAPEARGDTDHSMTVGHLGIGYFGAPSIPIGQQVAGTAGAAPTTLSAPIVGIRYWLQDSLGLDVGIGLNYQSGSTTNAGTTTNNPSGWAFVLHGGLPIVLFDAKHYTFFVEPVINLGFAGGTIPGTGGAGDTSLSGHLYQVGGRVGAQVSFGFIGIPHLALDAKVGLDITISGGTTSPPGGAGDLSSSATGISTLNYSQPWDIFRQDVDVVYYF